MPFKMISPLKRMATTAIKKMKDLSGDGKVTQKDVLIGRGVINPDGTKVKSPNKITGLRNYEDTINTFKAVGRATGFSDYLERNRKAAVERDLRQGYDTKATRALKESRDKAAKKRIKKLTGAATANQNAGQTMQQQMDKVKKFKASERKKPDGVLPKVTTKPPKKATGGSSTPPKSDTAAGDNLKRIAEEVRKRKAAQNKKELAPTGRRVSETVKPPKKLASAENIQKLATGKKRMQGMKDQAKRMTQKSNLRDEIKKLRESDTKKGRKKTFNTAASKEAGKKISNQELIKQKKKKKRELAKKIRKYRRDPNTLKVSKAKK